MAEELEITWADVEGIAPELATLPSGQQSTVLDQVREEIRPSRWGSQKRALIGGKWLAAHLGSVLQQGGGKAPLQSLSAGGVSKSYAMSVAQDDSSLQTTRYGREFTRLAKIYGRRLAVT